MERVLGDLQTAKKQLAGLEAERLNADRLSRSDSREAALRSADEESLKKQIETLQRQRALLETRRDELSLRSPIDGHVMTWDAEQLLQSRPVARGQILLTVADLAGPWVVELEIPDDHIADVTAARQVEEESLNAHFILATAPEQRYQGDLKSLAPATDVRGDGLPHSARSSPPSGSGGHAEAAPGCQCCRQDRLRPPKLALRADSRPASDDTNSRSVLTLPSENGRCLDIESA